MMRQICVFCEGKTEYNYIQSLNRLLKKSDVFDLRFTAKDLKGINKNNYCSKIVQFKAKELKAFTEFYAWLDYDVFKREGENKQEIKKRISEITFNANSVELLLNQMNGEDFIILHEENPKIKEWVQICNKKNHFKNPMHCNTYLPLFEKIMPGYKKGILPELDKGKIEKCIENINDSSIPFSSDMEKILKKIIARINLS